MISTYIKHTWNFVKITCKKMKSLATCISLKVKFCKQIIILLKYKKHRLTCIHFFLIAIKLSKCSYVNVIFTRFMGEEQHTSGRLHSLLMNILKGGKIPVGLYKDPDHIFCVRVYVNSDGFVECELLHITKPWPQNLIYFFGNFLIYKSGIFLLF